MESRNRSSRAGEVRSASSIVGNINAGWEDPMIKRLREEEYDDWLVSITDAAVSRLRPVTMAAITTILGMAPLLGDEFFQPMAVTIMFGLGFATLLTLFVVPVLFALFYGVRYSD